MLSNLLTMKEITLFGLHHWVVLLDKGQVVASFMSEQGARAYLLRVNNSINRIV